MAVSDNHLLSSLSTSDFDLLKPDLKHIALTPRKPLERPNRRIEVVYFPESGFASVVAALGDKQVEVGVIGREGMTGLPIVLGNHRSPHATFVQAPGKAQCIPSAELRTALRASNSLRDMLLKYVQAFGVQTTHTAICNAQSKLDIRLARWLLMAHDRVGSATLPLTHEFLSMMLAVRRAGVTTALDALRKQKVISYNRGTITILDRKRMEQIAGKTYGTRESEYRRLIGERQNRQAG
jgi:CRP-like cAMP-binding protein